MEMRRTPDVGNGKDDEEEPTKRSAKVKEVEERRTSATLGYPAGRRWRRRMSRTENGVHIAFGVQEFSFDQCLPGDEKGAGITVLVRRERVTARGSSRQ